MTLETSEATTRLNVLTDTRGRLHEQVRPADHSFGGDDDEGLLLSGPEPTNGDPEEFVEENLALAADANLLERRVAAEA